MDVLLLNFYDKLFENIINERMLSYQYKFPTGEVLNYIDNVNKIPVSEFLNYIRESNLCDSLTSRNIFQFSSLSDATDNLCRIIKCNNNPGYNAKELGKILLDDGKIRNDVAFTKYGENHGKTGVDFGLLYSLSNTYLLSCLGYVFNDLDIRTQRALFLRLLLRNTLVMYILKKTMQGQLVDRHSFVAISDSTYIRRKSNIHKVLSILTEQQEYDFSDMLKMVQL